MTTSRSHVLLGELDRLEALREPGKQGLREFRRHIIRGDAELHPMNRNRLDATPIEIKIRDISRGGLGFISSQPLAPGSSWRVCFVREGYVVGEQAMMVRHCEQVGEGTYLVGGRFVIDSGVLVTMGVPRSALRDQENRVDETENADAFVSPTDLEDDASASE